MKCNELTVRSVYRLSVSGNCGLASDGDIAERITDWMARLERISFSFYKEASYTGENR